VLVALGGFTAGAGLWWLVVLPALEQGAAGLPLYAVLVPVNVVLLLALPITLALAILRYRLWDIDLIIRRTLVHSVLSVLLALAYLSSVVVLQELVHGLTGQQAAVTVIASTLIIAAPFSPLRRRVQDTIDRCFYRSRYDAAQTLAQFGASLRDHVELDQLTGQLVAAVDKSIQPAYRSLWLSDLGAPSAQAPDAGAASARGASDTPAGSLS
jgi:hypothetical protein